MVCHTADMKGGSPISDCKHTSFPIYIMPVLSTVINVLLVMWFAMQRYIKAYIREAGTLNPYAI